MAYFKEYYSKLKEIKDQVISDVQGLDDTASDQLIASMLNFSKEVKHLMQIAANNSAIEGKASQAPEGVQTHWWAGSSEEPEYTGDHESNTP